MTFICALLMVAMCTAQADDKARIKALFSEMAAAVQHKNLGQLKALLAPDYSSTRQGQTISGRQTWLDKERAAFAGIGPIKACKVTVTRIELLKYNAIVDTSSTLKWWTKPAKSVKGAQKPHLWTYKSSDRNTLLKTRGGWQVESVGAISEEYLVDGKRSR